jgi:hypothetical protein
MATGPRRSVCKSPLGTQRAAPQAVSTYHLKKLKNLSVANSLDGGGYPQGTSSDNSGVMPSCSAFPFHEPHNYQ